MIDAMRFVRRPTPGTGRRAVTLYLGPALLLAAAVLPTLLLQDRLPRHQQPPYQWHELNWPAEALAVGSGLVAGWAVVLVIHLSSRSPFRRELWGLWVPLLYAVGGFAIALTAPSLVLNVDRPYGLAPDAGGLPRWAFTWAAIAACASAGVLLGRGAASTEATRRSATRAVWIAEVVAGRSWWLIQAVWALPLSLLIGALTMLSGDVGDGLQWVAGMAGTFALLAAWASRSTVTISPSGVRVSHGQIRLFGWELGIEQIAAVEVADVRLLRSTAAWVSCWTNLALRDGPALVIRTRWGGRRVVTLPDAEDAAAALRRWLAERNGA